MSPVIEVHAQAIQVAPDGPAPTGTFPASSVDLRVDEQGVVWLAASWPVFAAWCAPLSDEQNQVAAIEEIYQWNGSALTFAAAVPPVCGLPGRVRWAAGAGDPALAVYPYNLQEKVFRIDAPAVKALPQPPGVALAFGHSQGRLVGLVVVPDPASDGVRYGRDSWALLVGKPVLQSVRYDGAGWVVGGSLPVPPVPSVHVPGKNPISAGRDQLDATFPGEDGLFTWNASSARTFRGSDYGGIESEVDLLGAVVVHGGVLEEPFQASAPWPGSAALLGAMTHGEERWLFVVKDGGQNSDWHTLHTLVRRGEALVDAVPPLTLAGTLRGVQAVSGERLFIQDSSTLGVFGLGPEGWAQIGETYPSAEYCCVKSPQVRAVETADGSMLVAHAIWPNHGVHYGRVDDRVYSDPPSTR